MKRAIWFMLGLLVCGFKGWRNFVGLGPAEIYRDGFGFSAPSLRAEWNRFAGGEALSHLVTNIVVEWVSLAPQQRGVETLCALALMAIAAALGGIFAW